MTWGAIGGAAVSVVGGALLSHHGGSSGGSSATKAYDPYAPYRGQAADKLNQLMENPDYLQQLPEYKAALEAASRTMAAQGYTGSGNAMIAAAQAGGTAYQQAFNNLAMLSGANQSPAGAQSAANQQYNYQQQASNQMWGQIGGLAGRVIDQFGNSNSNIPAIPSVDTTPTIAPPNIPYIQPTGVGF